MANNLQWMPKIFQRHFPLWTHSMAFKNSIEWMPTISNGFLVKLDLMLFLIESVNLSTADLNGNAHSTVEIDEENSLQIFQTICCCLSKPFKAFCQLMIEKTCFGLLWSGYGKYTSLQSFHFIRDKREKSCMAEMGD